MNVTPPLAWPTGVLKMPSREASVLSSPPPKLMDTTATELSLAAYLIAVSRFANELSFASTSRMLALGASACDHSTSSDSSAPQLAFEAGGVEPPAWLTILKEGGAANL